ncbi:hypothetical protein AB6D20_027705 (plasmid) [Vibrio splendidus]
MLKQDVSQARQHCQHCQHWPNRKTAKSQNAPLMPHSSKKRSALFALNHLSEREAAFSQKALVVEAVRYRCVTPLKKPVALLPKSAFEEAGGSITKEQVETELTG